MEQKKLSNIVEGLTSRLVPAKKVSSKQLEILKNQLLSAVQEQNIEDILSGGLNRFDKINLQPEFSTADLIDSPETLISETKKEVISEETKVSSLYRVFRREVPVRTSQYEASVPKWAAGQVVDHILGPFIDNFGKWYWFDFYKKVHYVTIARGSDLFLQIPVKGFLVAQQQYDLPAGSVWIRSQLFTSSAPAGAYTGLKIKGGRITFLNPITISGNSIIIGGSDDCELTVELDQPQDVPALDTTTGDDAQKVNIQLPLEAKFICKPGSVKILNASDMSLELYGSSYKFSKNNSAPFFEPVLNRILVPYKGSVNTCSVPIVKSSLFQVVGSATVNSNSWALPVTVATITQLGDAAGIGAVALKVKPGLTAIWEGLEKGPIQCNDAYLMTEPGRIAITAINASSRRAYQKFDLWEEINPTKKIRSVVDLQYAKQYVLIYNCLSNGNEALIMTNLAMQASIDRPVTADKQRLKINALNAITVFSKIKNDRYVFLQAKDMMQQLINAGRSGGLSPVSFALSNALIKTTPVDDFYLIGKWLNKSEINEGTLIMNCPVYFLLPTLPDPYVTNFNPLANIGRSASVYNARSGISLIPFIKWFAPSTPELMMIFVPDTTSGDVFFAIGKENHNKSNNPNSNLQDTVSDEVDQTQVSENQINFSSLAFKRIKIDRTKEIQAEDQLNTDNLRGIFNNNLHLSKEQIYLLDVSTNADLFGVGLSVTRGERKVMNANFPFSVIGMDLVTYAFNTRVYTLPQIQWEPLRTIQNSKVKPHPFPSPTTSPDTGDPTIIGTESFELVPIAPKPVIEKFITAYNDPVNPRKMAALFSLPFGMKAVALLDNATDLTKQGALVSYNSPSFDKQKMEGGLQITVLATSPDSGPDAESPGLKGATIQTRNLIELLTGKIPLDDEGKPLSVLGPVVDTIFNGEFKPAVVGGANPRVPLERMDLSGYGATIFSNWLNPMAQIAATSQAKFDVLIGRTSHEVIQVKSILYPWGAAVVRTITIQRTSGGGVTRHDSGWKAQRPGLYDFSYTDTGNKKHLNPFEFHPGVIKGIYNVTEIRDTGRIYRQDAANPLDSVAMQEVFFNADVLMEDVIVGASNNFVPSKKQRGFIQLAPYQKPLTPQQFYDLLETEGALGGTVDCVISVGESGQNMRIVRVDVNAAENLSSKIFVSAGHGSLALPKEGSWSLVKRKLNTSDIVTLNEDAAFPLIREGKLNTSPTQPYRFADPVDIKNTSSPLSDYALLHSTGSQKVLFLRPTIQRNDKNIKSSISPYFADSFAILGSKGIFPPLDTTFQLGGGGTTLQVNGNGMLKLTSGGNFKAPVGFTRDLLNNGSSRIYVDYSDVAGSGGTTDIAYSFDSLAPVPWQANIKNQTVVVDLMAFKSLISVTTDFNADASKRPEMGNPKLKFGSILQPIIDILSFLGNFDMAQAFSVNMGNATTDSWQPKWKASLTGLEIEFPLLEIRVFGFHVKGPSEAVKKAFELATPLPPLKLKFEIEIEAHNNMRPFSFSSNDSSTDIAEEKHEMLSIGAALKFGGEIRILCVAISPTLGLYFLGIIEFEFGIDSHKGKSFGFKVAVGLELATKWPIVGEVSIMMALGVEMEWSDSGSGMFVIMIFKGEAELLEGLIVIGISIEAKGGQEKEISGGTEETFAVCEVEFAAEVSIAFVINFEFDVTWQEKKQIA